MSYVFTTYVRALGSTGEPPDTETFEGIWRALRGVVRSELRRRSLWDVPPACLGIYGWSSWASPGPGGHDGLDELVADCYTYVFLDRLRSLRAQLKVKPNVEGLVFRSVRNFLHDTQKRHDPLGYRVFAALRGAVDRAVDSGRLHVLRGGPKITNETVLGAAPTTEPALAEGLSLDWLARPWSDELLPDLVTAAGSARGRVIEALAERLGRLPSEGVEAFAFKSLADPLKAAVRAHWASWLRQDSGETAYEDAGGLANVVRVMHPDTSFEDRESFERLAACVAEGLERLEAQSRTRRHLTTLWNFLLLYAADGELRRGGRAATIGGEVALPSQRQLARMLGIPRERFPDLFETLGGLVETCLPLRPAEPSGAAWRQPAPPETEKVNVMSLDDLQDGLRRRTAEAARRELEAEETVDGDVLRPLRPGELVSFPESADLGVEWLLLERTEVPRRRSLAIAADTVPMAGSRDLAVPEASGLGPLVLRCDCLLELDDARLAEAVRTGSVDGETVERARRRRAAIEAGEEVGTALEREVDAEPEYREWLETLSAAAALVAAVPGSAAGGPPAPATSAERASEAALDEGIERPAPLGAYGPFGPPYAMAAAVLLVIAVGLVAGLIWQTHSLSGSLAEARRQIAELEREGPEAIANLPIYWLHEPQQERGDEERIVLPPELTHFQLVFQLPTSEPTGATYRLELVTKGGTEVVWAEGGLSDVSGLGELSLAIRRQVLPAGRYSLYLYREGQDPPEPVARYGLELVKDDH